MDDQILALYALSSRDIVDAFQEMYGAEVSATLVSKVTDRVLDNVTEWQSRPLDPIYPIVYLDCIVLKIRQNKQVVNKSMYVAPGINREGQKELLGLWLAETEAAAQAELERFLQAGRQVPADQQILAQSLAKPDYAVRVPGGDPEGDLHHQCYRITELCHS